ncbi:MAG: GAF domain-containing protein [Wenzhouxiangellaceae bacterium]
MSSLTVEMTNDYDLLARQAQALLSGERDPVANAANLASLIYHALPQVNWAGFYFTQGEELVLGPFHGQPACVRIPWGRGVCGAAASTGTTQRVADVLAFDGHIACDPVSRSEVVVPLTRNGQVIGVLDIDSPQPDRFSVDDQRGLETLAELWLKASD